MVRHQASLLEEPLKPLPDPEYVFRYEFVCGGAEHSMRLHDWEVQTTYHKYKREYGGAEAGLDKMTEFYERRAPAMNLHLIMGTMHARPWQFICIGVLRTTADTTKATAQRELL